MHEKAKTLRKVIAKCWADEDFKQKLLTDPIRTLRAEGVEVPGGISIRVVENTDTARCLVIPQRPNDLTNAALDEIAGAGIPSTGSHGVSGSNIFVPEGPRP